MKMLMALMLFSLSAGAFATTDISVECNLADGPKNQQKFIVQNPYGGGKSFKFKTNNGDIVETVVMISENEDDSNLFDLHLMISSQKTKGLTMASANGLSYSKGTAKAYGLSSSVILDKNGKITNALVVGCSI